MSVNIQSLSLTSSLKLLRDTDADATVEANVNNGAATLYLVQVDNSANTAQAVYLKLWNALAPAIGTAVDMAIPVGAGATLRLAIPSGLSFSTGLSVACVATSANKTAGTGSPTNDVAIALVYV